MQRNSVNEILELGGGQINRNLKTFVHCMHSGWLNANRGFGNFNRVLIFLVNIQTKKQQQPQQLNNKYDPQLRRDNARTLLHCSSFALVGVANGTDDTIERPIPLNRQIQSYLRCILLLIVTSVEQIKSIK